MGLKKTSRRLLKLGRQAAREMGEGGRDFVDTVFRTAVQVLEEAIRRGTSKVSPAQTALKRSKTTAASKPGRQKPPPKPAKARSTQVKKAPAPSHRHAAQHSRASRPTRPPARSTRARPPQRKSVPAPAQRSSRRPRAPRPPRAAAVIRETPELTAPAAADSTATEPGNGSLV